MNEIDISKRVNILKAITAPLGFFVLSLLIVEGFLGIVLIFAKEPRSIALNVMGLTVGAILFVLVVVLVFLLVWHRPANLTLEGEHYFKMEMHEGIEFSSEVDTASDPKKLGESVEQYIEKYPQVKEVKVSGSEQSTITRHPYWP